MSSIRHTCTYQEDLPSSVYKVRASVSSFHGYYRVKLYQGVPCVACLNLKTYGVIILSLFLRLVVVVGILMNKILIFSDFHIYAIATFWAMSLVGIYPGHFLLLAKLNNKIA